jgi:drug/metabolite transporter (DMT)-like permease
MRGSMPFLKSAFSLMLLSQFFFSLMAALAKYACGTLSSSEVVFFRCLFATIPILLYHYVKSGPRGPLFGHNRRALTGRGIAGAIALNLYFIGLAGLPVVDAMLLNQTSPLFVIPLGVILLHETAGRRQLLILPFALIGVAMVLQPNFQMVNLAGFAALGSAFFSAIAYIYVRKLAGTDEAHTIVLYFTLFSMAASAPFMVTGFIMPEGMMWLALACIGLLSIGGQLCMTLALHLDTAGHVSVFQSFGVVFATAWDFLFWDKLPGAVTALGALLVVVSLTELNRNRRLSGKACYPKEASE